MAKRRGNMDNTRKRIEWMDFAKCVAIILVIAGHVLSWSHSQYKAIYMAIYSMHMPFFFMLSGMTFNVHENETFNRFIHRKAKAILLPLLLFCIIEVGFQLLFENLAKRITAKLVVESFLFMNGGAFSKYWFLPALFVAEAILFLIFQMFNSENMRLMVAALIGLGGYTVISSKLSLAIPL